MNKKLLQKLTGIVSAVAVGTSYILPAAALGTEKKAVYDDIVQVIVELYGDPVLAADTGNMGADYLDTYAAKARVQQLENMRHNAFGEILSLYPDAELDFTYDAVFNGFACTLPRELIDEASKLSGIKDIMISKTNQIPSMQTYRELTGINKFCADTDITGKGKVIAVIDTELNLDHEMFSAFEDDSFVKLTKDDIKNAVENRGLNFDIDPDSAYRSSKIPYAVSLINKDDRYAVGSDVEEMFHGTHVCGIAAGNRVDPYDDGDMMSGAAPDAQLIFMAGFDYSPYFGPSIDDSVAVAGIEDAVKLGADVVNLSFGQHCLSTDQEELYGTVLKNADNAGVVVCAAVGNSGTPESDPADVDRSIIDTPGFLDDVFTVAATGVSFDLYNRMELADDTKVYCLASATEEKHGKVKYEFVNCGSGSKEEIEAHDVKGKLVLVENVSFRNDLYETELNAKKAGAAGVLLCSCDNDFHSENQLFDDPDFIAIGTDLSGSKRVLAQTDHHIIVDLDEYTEHEIKGIADFSSIGSVQTLELKPEIAAPGQGVLSASYDGYESMDGTSMATPFAAGCSALAAEYIENKGWKVSGSEKTALVKALLMNTAEKVMLDDIPYSPRRQGAGMVDMNALGNCCVTMTNNGDASVCLGSMLGDEFSFDVTLHNYGDKDVHFKSADLIMISESVEDDEFTYSPILTDKPAVLEHSAVFSTDDISVNAGSEMTFTVNVTLDPDNVNTLDGIFKNGWFAEGYLTLSGAEYCSDISVPITGFHGDWNAAPIIGDDFIEGNTEFMENVMKTPLLGNYLPASVSISEYLNAFMIEDFETASQKMDEATRHRYFISPNQDDIADIMCYNYFGKRTGILKKAYMTGQNGSIIPLLSYENPIYTQEASQIYLDPVYFAEDGDYTLDLEMEPMHSDRDITAQKKSLGITVDTVPPSVSDIKIAEKGGRKILTIKAQDKHPEGIYIIGSSSGDNKGIPFETVQTAINNLDPNSSIIPAGTGVGSVPKNRISSTDLFSFFDDVLYIQPDKYDYDFFDAVPAVPNENGCLTFSYDITDLSDYTITITDRGYNSVTYTENLPFVNSIPSSQRIDKGTLLKDIKVPDHIYNGKIVSKGWEIYNEKTYEWEALPYNTRFTEKYNNRQIRYAVRSEECENYSNPMLLLVNGVSLIKVTVYSDGQVIYCRDQFPSPMNMDLFYSWSPDPFSQITNNTEYRIEMEADGYVTRVMEFDGNNVPSDIDVYLNRLGDINGDGTLNVTDISKAAAHIKSKRSIGEYEQVVADVNCDGKFNITDISKLAARIKGKKVFA